MKKLGTVALALLPLAAGAASAQELKIGVASEATSIDPHFHNVGQNNALRRHIFEGLVTTDQNQKLVPALAESWKAVDDTTWEFKLRPNVKFSNGTPFTATDFVYTLCRVPTVENSPSSFTVFTRGFETVETPDPLTVRIKTTTPQPLLPTNMTTIGILSAKVFGGENVKWGKTACENLGTVPKSSDFNSPEKAIGTGAYRLVEYTRGTHVVLERNEDYWGTKPEWKRVTMRPITSAGPRVAALLAGDVDLIENPPIQDFAKIKESGFTVAMGLSNRVIYIHLDSFAEPTPGVKGAEKNPFKDPRVRLALSKSINREAIVERIMGRVAQPAGELLPHPLFGTRKDAKPVAFDPDGAKKLLAEAGYPNGFELVLGSPNDRYINDEKVAQAVAQMFTRIGVKTTVDSMTASTFFGKRNKHEFSAYLAGWGADSGEMSNPLTALVMTPNKETGAGNTNYGRYSNKELDALVTEAKSTIDDKKREALLHKASDVLEKDAGIIPLHFEVTPWAFKKGLIYAPRVDQYTMATEVKSSK
ncbi:ABC transporter substrate-binding protein [Chelatococcus sp. SYSU_G07232]|uniref:ABC transporter substrate-binding protein n=1 Tax=Chelatococcus albus TaxID=3047466 RepID=A0ABT7AJ83_9HYPH|nr:ABC transporter substrate-binding protein [Chelatococcus sp. SYSU_G07232]MDJ1159437.1 ABC transporter substrate-binding protein [Chelatococcus sp. SYSU_G07232]